MRHVTIFTKNTWLEPMRYALIAFLLLPVACLPQSKEEYSSTRITKELVRNGFSKMGSMGCGDFQIIITTSCIEQIKDVPYCFSQTVSFLGETGIESSVTFDYPFEGGNQPFIADAVCMRSAGDYLVVLQKTNFGNCRICEWIDIYTNTGTYRGSTKGIYMGKRRKNVRQADPKVVNTIQRKLHARDIEDSISIYRKR